MASPVSSLPEELVLQTLNHLHSLRDLYAIMLTCKQFHRISCEIPAAKTSHLALHSGNYFPGLRPLNHILLLAAARGLSQWAVEDDSRSAQLKNAMHGGIAQFAAFAMKANPITLADIRTVWAWKTNTLNPLGKRLDLSCGPSTREENFTLCEDPEIALFIWAIYGELFHPMVPFDRNDRPTDLDCVSRFKFLVYCSPDMNSFNYRGIDKPTWFEEMETAEKFQQLSLSEAISNEMTLSTFADDIRQLIGLDLDIPSDFMEPGQYTKDTMFAQVVMNSGRRALDVMQQAERSRFGLDRGITPVDQWLWDTWAFVADVFDTDSHGTVLAFVDPWLDAHSASLQFDLQYTLWDSLYYPLQQHARLSEEEKETALGDAVASHD